MFPHRLHGDLLLAEVGEHQLELQLGDAPRGLGVEHTELLPHAHLAVGARALARPRVVLHGAPRAGAYTRSR